MFKINKKSKGLALSKAEGFTLIEILIVIGIIAILATIVIIAINPARQFAQARNTQRTSNVNTILNAIGQRTADGKGTFAGSIVGSSPAQTCPGLTVGAAPLLTVDTDYPLHYDADTGVVAGNLHIACLVPTYMPSYVIDPKTGTATVTGYTLRVDGNGRITIKAPAAELSEVISVAR